MSSLIKKTVIYVLVTLGVARLIWALREAPPYYAMMVMAGICLTVLAAIMAAVYLMVIQRKRLVALAIARHRARPRSRNSILKYRT